MAGPPRDLFEIWLKSGAADAWAGAMRGAGAGPGPAAGWPDPSWLLAAMGEEPAEAFGRLFGAPPFAGAPGGAGGTGDAAAEAAAFAAALSARQALAAAALGRAFDAFAAALAEDPAAATEGRAMALWLEHAGRELTALIESAPFLAAERRLLAAGAAYRTAQRALVEGWCRALDMPTRTEVDELHRTVQALRRALASRAGAGGGG